MTLSRYFGLHLIYLELQPLSHFLLELLCFPATCIWNIINGLLETDTGRVNFPVVLKKILSILFATVIGEKMLKYVVVLSVTSTG